jgi:hypothetical protein
MQNMAFRPYLAAIHILIPVVRGYARQNPGQAGVERHWRATHAPGSIHGIDVVCVNSKIISSTTVSLPMVRSTGVILVSAGMFGIKWLP